MEVEGKQIYIGQDSFGYKWPKAPWKLAFFKEEEGFIGLYTSRVQW